jgi:glyoxylase-like metal-dependent hydrolase (beta-lactamase superfamily II)
MVMMDCCLNMALQMEEKTMTYPRVKHFFDESTDTFSYVVQDPESSACAVIDSVLDCPR